MPSPDYCTWWPDALLGADWSRCCAAHDAAYLAQSDRIVADLELARCVMAVNWPMGVAMGAGVLAFGWVFYNRKRRLK
jgi:hypothetical protein